VICDTAAVTAPDAVIVDALARLQLTAKRSGSTLQIRHAGDELLGLIELAGLTDVVPVLG
jgi:ABC-type transporter Mla MlaB component